MAGQKLKQIDGNGEAIRVTSFISDLTPPALRTFEFDLDSSKLHLTFTEAIDS
jgi:hypothetical protein